jgi:hypothetical protein
MDEGRKHARHRFTFHQRISDRLQPIVIQIQVLKLRELLEHGWVEVREEVLAQAQALEMRAEALEPEVLESGKAGVNELDILRVKYVSIVEQVRQPNGTDLRVIGQVGEDIVFVPIDVFLRGVVLCIRVCTPDGHRIWEHHTCMSIICDFAWVSIALALGSCVH